MLLRRSRPGEVLTRLGDGTLEDVLREVLRDPALLVVLRVTEHEWSRPDAVPCPPPVPTAEHPVTELHHAGELVAAVVHGRPLGRDSRLVASLSAAASLAAADAALALRLRLAAEAARRARTAVVAAEDAARRGIERDLHDGAQQRLVAAALGVELVRLGLTETDAPDAAEALERTRAALQRALAELRRLARGVFPAILAEQGLRAALTTLAEESAPRLHLGALPDCRWPAPLETAAYFAVAVALATAGSDGVRVSVRAHEGQLRVHLIGVRFDPARLLAVRDRVEAAGGSLALDDAEATATIVLGGEL